MVHSNPKAHRVLLPLDKISLMGDTQPRAERDYEVVREYADAYAAGQKLPPLTVYFDGKTYWLVDGFHRWFAARDAKIVKLPCLIYKGTLEQARWASYSVNQTHGLRRTNADKEKAVRAALRHSKGRKMSDRAIAEYVGVSQPFVGRIRAELSSTDNGYQSEEKRVGRDGRSCKVKRKSTATTQVEEAQVEQVVIEQTEHGHVEPVVGPVAQPVEPVSPDLREFLKSLSGPLDEWLGKLVSQFNMFGNENTLPQAPMLLLDAMNYVLRRLAALDEWLEATPPTCSNCGGHEVDEDGDCLKCKEPGIVEGKEADADE